MTGKARGSGEIGSSQYWNVILHGVLAYVKYAAGNVVAMELLRPVYRAALQAWPYNHHSFYVVGTILCHGLMYWGMNSIFYACDTFQWIQHRKMDREDRHKLRPGIVRECLTEAVKDQLISMPLTLSLVWYLVRYAGMEVDTPAPGPVRVFWVIMGSQIILDVGFYWAHRWLHTPKMYWIHKKHHEFKGSIGFAAEYAHPFEKFLANNLPTALPSVVFGMHLQMWWVWMSWRLWETFEAHSGYVFPWFHGEHAIWHDYHHTANVGNFGSQIMDTIFRTDKHFRKEFPGGAHTAAPPGLFGNEEKIE